MCRHNRDQWPCQHCAREGLMATIPNRRINAFDITLAIQGRHSAQYPLAHDPIHPLLAPQRSNRLWHLTQVLDHPPIQPNQSLSYPYPHLHGGYPYVQFVEESFEAPVGPTPEATTYGAVTISPGTAQQQQVQPQTQEQQAPKQGILHMVMGAISWCTCGAFPKPHSD
ncbi:hypothetical protein EX30DRAFT_236064 [Ascodesmis nigricans]|uniref:Uncharacterized protein n=1 Tax=Ascodesmis nigricans TaxID=341454 RepID=A0A4S2MZ07_9PEZI|nr:hypothetical protein EX30DRAFT_236064 [Ascodesmis nigricans]